MLRLDHVQLAIPPGSEDLCRRFYVDLLGMEDRPGSSPDRRNSFASPVFPTCFIRREGELA